MGVVFAGAAVHPDEHHQQPEPEPQRNLAALFPAEWRAEEPFAQVHRHEPQGHGNRHDNERVGDQPQYQQAGKYRGRFHRQPAALHIGVVLVIVRLRIIQWPPACQAFDGEHRQWHDADRDRRQHTGRDRLGAPLQVNGEQCE
ncbi:hypothetical protein D3C77_599940 [compost metagenome]